MDQQPNNLKKQPGAPPPPTAQQLQQEQQQRQERSERNENWRRTVFLFKRNKRQLFGFLLLCIVGGIIAYVALKPKEPKTAGAWRSKLGSDASSNSDGTDAKDSQSDSQSPTDWDPDSTTQTPGSSIGSENQKSKDHWKTASVPELIEELLSLRDKNATSAAINFVTLQQRVDVGSHLLTKELTKSQKRFATIDYIESIIQLDAINNSGNIKADYIRNLLIEVRDKYSEHSDDGIGAKASLVYILVPIHDYFDSGDESNLSEVADLFDEHAEKILRHNDTTARFAKLILDLFGRSDFSPAHAALATRLMKRLEKEEDPDVIKMAKGIREQIYFAKSELGSLVERIEGGNSIARDDVQRLFEGLDSNPSSRIEIYKIATNVIAEYSRLKHKDDADALMKWLISINERNENQEVREQMAEEIAQFDFYRKLGTETVDSEFEPHSKRDTGNNVSNEPGN